MIYVVDAETQMPIRGGKHRHPEEQDPTMHGRPHCSSCWGEGINTSERELLLGSWLALMAFPWPSSGLLLFSARPAKLVVISRKNTTATVIVTTTDFIFLL